MANIYVEAKGPKGVQAKESLLPAAVSGFMRGLAVVYGSDQYHAALASALGQACVGILAEDAISTLDACAVIEFGQCVAQIGANITAQQLLTVNAAGQLIPAGNGQAVLAVASRRSHSLPRTSNSTPVDRSLPVFWYCCAPSASVTASMTF